MLAAVNQAIFVPNLPHSKTFEWKLERRVFICKNGTLLIELPTPGHCLC
jgi:hypothetical protein